MQVNFRPEKLCTPLACRVSCTLSPSFTSISHPKLVTVNTPPRKTSIWRKHLFFDTEEYGWCCPQRATRDCDYTHLSAHLCLARTSSMSFLKIYPPRAVSPPLLAREGRASLAHRSAGAGSHALRRRGCCAASVEVVAQPRAAILEPAFSAFSTLGTP